MMHGIVQTTVQIGCWNAPLFGKIFLPQSLPSKAQKGVTLSSSEAEYVAISDAVKEIKFL
jgi:hypothetical protein